MTADIDPVFQDITPANKSVPRMKDWYLTSTVSGVPEDSVPWMLAQGWEVVSTQTDITVFPWVVTYKMRRTDLQNFNVLEELLTDFTDAYNEGRTANDKRYEDVVKLWTEMLDKSQTHLDEAKTSLTTKLNLHLTTLDDLENEYASFFTDVKTDLDDLTVTLDADRTRVNDQFDAQLAASDQNMLNRGYYSSAMLPNIDAGIEERRALALTEITEREQRLKADITLRKNQVYVDVLRMRAGLVDAQMALTNREQEFLAYQLDERNRILTGLFGFVERRTDAYPDMHSLAQLTSSLAESGAATWQSR
tara:strand:+ start:19577 stop:20494 length:918 start_codon:yes stop_codon:yes gene_type:complete